MKKQQHWMFWIMPTINIVIMNVFQYIEDVWLSDGISNWWIQCLFIMVELFFYITHYILAFLIPVLLYKRKKIFTVRSGLFAGTAVLMANIIMLALEMMEVSFNYFPEYMIRPMCVTMVTVITVSTLLMTKRRHGIKYCKKL